MNTRYGLYDEAPQDKGRCTYSEIAEFLRKQHAFAGSSMSAFWTEDEQYVVLSYRTVIATYDGPNLIKIAENRWGPTTGRHINLCKENLS
jgi:hypothetical protein